jgi:hypothetical protein
MEFAAIALLINSYYCHKNRLPKTIEELEEWSGKELPTNRVDGTPYVIDTNGKHTLSFKNIKQSYSYYSKKQPQLNFDFSK